MQPRIPRQPAQDQGGIHADDDAGLGAELAAVVAGARRRAVRDGDRQVDTAHLLHSLIEYDPEVRDLVGDAPQLARLLGYLVQRSIGYGLRWQSGVEDSGALPSVGPGEGRRDGRTEGAWSPVATAAVEYARSRARRRGGTRAQGVDLLAGLVVDPESRAVQVLERAGVAARDLAARIDADGGLSDPGVENRTSSR
ncbi:Clp protease N-terminal domain-containing protein [Streptomyces arenae]|uniref:Clp protease N-terminal domain-containing protein n=1 Tax=Streptomyces arenae TaxID=29301 RepID=UPI002657C44F|nr:Clp protease N-terminal domain-containing protein [Streptomyces arenae]MCG7209317.1 peptidase [Streptomyces arenae]